jgi:hypothetical protein
MRPAPGCRGLPLELDRACSPQRRLLEPHRDRIGWCGNTYTVRTVDRLRTLDDQVGAHLVRQSTQDDQTAGRTARWLRELDDRILGPEAGPRLRSRGQHQIETVRGLMLHYPWRFSWIFGLVVGVAAGLFLRGGPRWATAVLIAIIWTVRQRLSIALAARRHRNGQARLSDPG